MVKDVTLLLGCLLLCFGAAGLGAYFNSFGLGAWYDGLVKPSWNPPSWVFGPVWTVLYTMMAVSLWLVWRKHGWAGARNALLLFLVHLVLNAAWSGIFFALHRPGWAFVEIVLLWCSIVAVIRMFHPLDARAAYLLVPYLLWVSFATVLNGALFWLNR